MMKTLKKLFAVSLPALLMSLLLLELLVRLLLPVSDAKPQSYYNHADDLIQFIPNQQGKSIRYDIAATFHINAQGWNHPQDYSPSKTPTETRIAVIGDSYIEAQQVDVDQQMAVVLQNQLAASRVYSFGVSGAPLSHYLHLLRHAGRYQPDIYIINIIHNDFQESFRDIAYKPHFLQFALTPQGAISEVAPLPFYPSYGQKVFRTLAHAALFRYVWFNLDYGRRWVGGGSVSDPNAGFAEDAGVDLAALTGFAFAEYRQAAGDAHLLLVIDAPRDSLYAGQDPRQSPQYIYNQIAAEQAAALGIPLLDLTDTFAQDYQQHGRVFNYADDYHWNAYGHDLVARAVAAELMALGWAQ